MTSRLPPNVRVSLQEFNTSSGSVQRLLTTTAEGRNPFVNFPFREIRLPRGYVDHPPNTDRFEVRKSITVEFRGTPQGSLIVHMFQDGSIKTREEMHREQNERREEQMRLAEEESQFPDLNQTATRQQAYARLVARIDALRRDSTRSVIAKQTEKLNAETEYRTVLDEQRQERLRAARALSAQRFHEGDADGWVWDGNAGRYRRWDGQKWVWQS